MLWIANNRCNLQYENISQVFEDFMLSYLKPFPLQKFMNGFMFYTYVNLWSKIFMPETFFLPSWQ